MILLGFVRVPLLLNYLDTFSYGVWLTIGSVINWLAFFDIGLGNGLRNKLTEALSNKNYQLARVYISTTYIILILLASFLTIMFLIFTQFINWSAIFKVPSLMVNELQEVILIVFLFFALRFVVQLVNTVLIANQKPALSSSIALIEGIIFLAIVWILHKTTVGSLLNISFASGFSGIFVLLIANIIFFTKYCRNLAPSFRYTSFKHLREIVNLGIQFFLIQIAVIIIFSTDNLIITQILGPEEVVPYNIAFRYLGVISLGFGTLMIPLWAAYTEAYVKNDMLWIKSTINKTIQIWLLSLLGVCCLIFASGKVYEFWFGNKVAVPIILTISMGAFVLIQAWNMIFVHFINATGKVRLQLYCSILAAVVNIPISVYLAKDLGLGSTGVILGSCVSLSFAAILAPIQYYKIANGKAVKLWAK